MINSVPMTHKRQKYGRRQIIRDSGYTAIGAGTLCGITGFKQVKFSHKLKIHKYSAYLAALFTLVHLVCIKGWDKKLFAKFSNKNANKA